MRAMARLAALTLVVELGACGATESSPDLGTSAPAPTASASVAATASTVPEAPCQFGTPENLGATLNSPGFEGGPTPGVDGLHLYFISDRSGSHGGDIWVAGRTSLDVPFGSPQNLGPSVNGERDEGAPTLSSDELVLFFDRDDGGIWASSRPSVDTPFGTATRLGEPVNTRSGAGFPALSADGRALYFSSARQGGEGGLDIWLATRSHQDGPFETVRDLGPPVDAASDDGMATVSRDALTLVLASRRDGGLGDWDLWLATRTTADEAFGTPVNLGPKVNSDRFEGRPHLSSDGSVLFFMSDRPGGQGAVDLWQASVDCVHS